ncbi:MAG: hypothetical protein DSM107014_03065 [Gomphosphaeria aponina SAG 52.96 = DSM 107014]|uniref:Glycosyl transferase family 28 C-terminal domain-containing protein n=1 Tax=Gomphosphaeria aponina SAG 52.96 = DSM 107014 TaxID=1521640 RepID=A0A941GTW3_9CHRO|nr:hypothetical protein [Gomphosphaeria aponina SAG 52.96 = DSM 107014]
MIFLTVGSQLPFERLVRVVDEWAAVNNQKVQAQIGKSQYQPKYIKGVDFIQPRQYDKLFKKARVVIAHAGTGVIMNALELQKPIIVMPRQEKFLEHRNDHQMATAIRFKELLGVYVAMNEEELGNWLGKINELKGGYKIQPYASGKILEAITELINA